jgi:hypothetical protein
MINKAAGVPSCVSPQNQPSLGPCSVDRAAYSLSGPSPPGSSSMMVRVAHVVAHNDHGGIALLPSTLS